MASPPPRFEAEDQTDEDFFDNLVSDDFAVEGSGTSTSPAAAGISRALSSLSIGDSDDAVFADDGPQSEASGETSPPLVIPENGESGSVPPAEKSVAEVELTPAAAAAAAAEVESHEGLKDIGDAVGSVGPAEVGPAFEQVSDVAAAASGGGAGSKGTSVKVVQWSAFSGGSELFGSGGFGSESEFLVENAFASGSAANADLGSAFGAPDAADFYGSDPGANFAPFGDSDAAEFYGGPAVNQTHTDAAQFYGSVAEQPQTVAAQFYGSAVGQTQTDATQLYGTAVGQTQTDATQFYGTAVGQTQTDATQFYGTAVEQTDVAQFYGSAVDQTQTDATQFYGSAAEQTQDAAAINSQSWEDLYPGWKFDSATGQWYQVEVDKLNTTEAFQDHTLGDTNGFVPDQGSENYYAQQSETPAVVASTEVWQTADSSEVSQVSNGYPPNMVFDSQYPEWYFDTNSQQWLTLESYHQTVQQAVGTVSEQLNRDVNATNGFVSNDNSSIYNGVGQYEQKATESHSNQETGWGFPASNNSQPITWQPPVSNNFQQNTWQPEPINQNLTGFYGKNNQNGNIHVSAGLQDSPNGPFRPSNHEYSGGNGSMRVERFVPTDSISLYSQPKLNQGHQGHSNGYYDNKKPVDYNQPSHHNEGRSSAGRPPHALVCFGFGGKLIVMKDGSSLATKMDYGNKDAIGGSISILNLMEVVIDKTDKLGVINCDTDYFHALCQQSFPGPLVGGNAATKDVNKWLDEKIASCGLPEVDIRKGELSRLLFSLLKISCQHYGKLRSPFGADSSLEETDGPEAAVTKLFASVRDKGSMGYGHSNRCIQNLPSEAHIRTTAAEVQTLLVSGRRKEALQCAQAGQLWGPALVLAAQLGDQYYVDTVRQMAHHQFASGSPLRTLCLLIAGQPADVFSAYSANSNAPLQHAEIPANGMLDDWEENLAVIAANRTKGDELVIIHLGDCLWKERGEISAAHTCYMVAEANFESYSDSARLCLIGADHWKCPRTYASPAAIQRTELFEYSKVLGNSQFVLLPFQPYKLIYAYMLAEVGRVADSLRYCQSSLKLVKNAGRSPEVEAWKSSLSSLEERLRTHQQGGFGIAPGRFVGKIFDTLDKSISRMIGAPPSSLPPMPHGSIDGKGTYSAIPKVSSSQSTAAMSSLAPSPSVETMNEWAGDNSRKSTYNRSVSEPNFSTSPGQGPAKNADSSDAQSKKTGSGGPSRIGNIGSLIQRTMGWVPWSRSERQAKLGETNKFYYDEKLKRWMEEGAEPPAEAAALPPPPTIASFQNGMPNYNINSSFTTQNLAANGNSDTKPAIPSERSSGIPPASPSPNKFTGRGMTGVSRYVDTFNKSRAAPVKSFQSPSVPSAKPPVSAKFFVPTAPAVSNEHVHDIGRENISEAVTNGESSRPGTTEASFQSPSRTMQRHPSMNNIANSSGSSQLGGQQDCNGPLDSLSRASSWSGNYEDTHNPGMAEAKPLRVPGPQSSFMPPNPSNLHSGPLHAQLNGGNLGDDLHEVAL